MRFHLSTLALNLILPAFLLTTGTGAADDTYTGASGGPPNWFNVKNWDSGQLPTSADSAIIAVPGQTAANPVAIDNTADPAYKDKIAMSARLVVGDGQTAFLTIKSPVSVADSLRVGNSDVNHSGNGTVTQTEGLVDPGASPQIGTTSGLTGTYNLQGGAFVVGDTCLYIGGNSDPGQTAGAGSFIVSGGKLTVGSRVIFGTGGNASFTVIGSHATPIQIGEQFNADGAGLVNLNVQIDKGGLTPINTSILGLQGITLCPSFAQGVAPFAGTWIVATYSTLAGTSTTPVLGKGIDPAHWSAQLDTTNMKLSITYKP